MRRFASHDWMVMRGKSMKNSGKTGLSEAPAIDARNSSNVIRVELFQAKKKEEEYKKALDKVLLRAQKSDW
ncbi:MAG: hypothetical protein AAAB16_19405 [Pseudomonas sp.]|uniref:hypothetical protein n=1 Tax=Pseudomonas sp. TaxID=306 RepID=UPI0030F1D03A